MPTSIYQIGQRVAHIDGSIGIVENDFGDNDALTTDVRWLTPNNEPSVLVSMCMTEHLTPVPFSVLPMRRSKEWWSKQKEFQATIEGALQDLINNDSQ